VALAPPPELVVQHWMLAAPGQKSGVEVPPWAAQSEVSMQVPCSPVAETVQVLDAVLPPLVGGVVVVDTELDPPPVQHSTFAAPGQ